MNAREEDEDLSKPLTPSQANNEDEDLSKPIKHGVPTFLGTMQPFNKKEFFSPENVNEVIGAVSGSPGMKIIGSPTGLQMIGKGINYLRPEKTAQEFMTEIGAPKTSEENISELANRVHFARGSAASEALAHKKPVMESLGNFPIYNPLVRLILKKQPVPEHYTGDLKDAYVKFSNNPIFNNADKFSQQLFDEISSISKRVYEGKADNAEKNLLHQLIKDRSDIIRHSDKFMENQSPELKAEWDLFKNKWKKNVSIYDENPLLAEMGRKGTKQGFTDAEIKGIFRYPSSGIEKVGEQIGPSGKSNILYNELQTVGSKDPEDLAKELLDLNQNGYQKYLTDRMRELGSQLEKRTKARGYANLALKTGAGALIGEFLGHPLMGATLAASSKPILKYGKKVIDVLK